MRLQIRSDSSSVNSMPDTREMIQPSVLGSDSAWESVCATPMAGSTAKKNVMARTGYRNVTGNPQSPRVTEEANSYIKHRSKRGKRIEFVSDQSSEALTAK